MCQNIRYTVAIVAWSVSCTHPAHRNLNLGVLPYVVLIMRTHGLRATVTSNIPTLWMNPWCFSPNFNLQDAIIQIKNIYQTYNEGKKEKNEMDSVLFVTATPADSRSPSSAAFFHGAQFLVYVSHLHCNWASGQWSTVIRVGCRLHWVLGLGVKNVLKVRMRPKSCNSTGKSISFLVLYCCFFSPLTAF